MLQKVWGHSTLSRKRKLKLYESLIESKLLYGLPCGCLNVADRRRLDGFQARCLRQILKVPPAYYSRISNAAVLRQATLTKASTLLLRRQLAILGRILRCTSDSPLRTTSFIGGTLVPATSQFVRRVGRPRREWIPSVLEAALQITGTGQHLQQLVQDRHKWKEFVYNAVT